MFKQMQPTATMKSNSKDGVAVGLIPSFQPKSSLK